MVWDHLFPDKSHVAYACIGVFATCFSLFSLLIKDRLYIGEANLATIFGLIIGPHCLNWFDPTKWGNWSSITLEISRVMLNIQIFAVGFDLPKRYMLEHFSPVVILLIPVMTAGWLIVGLFIWILIPHLAFSNALIIAGCVTATDPVLAAAVVGKGKFSRQIPEHLRHLLSAESGANDGLTLPFVYLGLYLTIHSGHPGEIVKNWLCVTILYECVLGCILGAVIGYCGSKAIRFSAERKWIDKESFLGFYIVLALLCAGFGSVLGVDDLLVAFSAGAAFAWDGYIAEKNEESPVAPVMDLLMNMAYFIYFGSLIPWSDFNNPALGLNAWRLIVLAFVFIFLRRIPAVLLAKPIDSDIMSWKEALFVGHFGPIGVGSVYASLTGLGELEAHVLGIEHGPTTDYPTTKEYYQLIRIIWPIVCFAILVSMIVHGLSPPVIALFNYLRGSKSSSGSHDETVHSSEESIQLDDLSSDNSGLIDPTTGRIVRAEKAPGFKFQDKIIIEDSEGEIIGKYKVLDHQNGVMKHSSSQAAEGSFADIYTDLELNASHLEKRKLNLKNNNNIGLVKGDDTGEYDRDVDDSVVSLDENKQSLDYYLVAVKRK